MGIGWSSIIYLLPDLTSNIFDQGWKGWALGQKTLFFRLHREMAVHSLQMLHTLNSAASDLHAHSSVNSAVSDLHTAYSSVNLQCELSSVRPARSQLTAVWTQQCELAVSDLHTAYSSVNLQCKLSSVRPAHSQLIVSKAQLGSALNKAHFWWLTHIFGDWRTSCTHIFDKATAEVFLSGAILTSTSKRVLWLTRRLCSSQGHGWGLSRAIHTRTNAQVPLPTHRIYRSPWLDHGWALSRAIHTSTSKHVLWLTQTLQLSFD